MLHQSYVSSLVGLVQGLEMEKIPFQTAFLGNESLIGKARNDYIHYAINSEEKFTHILFIDADMGFEWSDFTLLRDSGKRIISSLCPKKKYPIEFVVGEPLGEPEADGTQRVTYASIAFCLIDLKVFTKDRGYVNRCYKTISSLTGKEEETSNWFSAGPNEKGIFLGEDRAFFEKMAHLGEPIYVNLRSAVTHTGNHTFKAERAEGK